MSAEQGYQEGYEAGYATALSEHFCGCCGNQIGAGTRSDPSWCARCKPHIKGHTNAPLWDRTWFAQHKTACPFQV